MLKLSDIRNYKQTKTILKQLKISEEDYKAYLDSVIEVEKFLKSIKNIKMKFAFERLADGTKFEIIGQILGTSGEAVRKRMERAVCKYNKNNN